jgi:hypothetical protein
MKVNVCGPKDKPKNAYIINVTSSAKNWSKALSPLYLGPVQLPNGHISQNLENAWQFSKVYSKHVDPDGWPTNAYFRWAKKGWDDKWAHRYPMGKGAVPEYSYWNHKRLGYIEARKQIYIPLYENVVLKTQAWNRLKQEFKNQSQIWLFDFDGYDNEALGMTLEDVLHCKDKKMGHAFVLARMLNNWSHE